MMQVRVIAFPLASRSAPSDKKGKMVMGGNSKVQSARRNVPRMMKSNVKRLDLKKKTGKNNSAQIDENALTVKDILGETSLAEEILKTHTEILMQQCDERQTEADEGHDEG